MPYTFEQCKRIFDGAIAKYEGQDFFSKLIQKRGKPAFPSTRQEVAMFGIRHEGKETKFRKTPPTTQSASSVWIAIACRRFTNMSARPNPAYSTR